MKTFQASKAKASNALQRCDSFILIAREGDKISFFEEGMSIGELMITSDSNVEVVEREDE